MGLSGLRGSKSSDVERVARGEVAAGFLPPVNRLRKIRKILLILQTRTMLQFGCLKSNALHGPAKAPLGGGERCSYSARDRNKELGDEAKLADSKQIATQGLEIPQNRQIYIWIYLAKIDLNLEKMAAYLDLFGDFDAVYIGGGGSEP